MYYNKYYKYKKYNKKYNKKVLKKNNIFGRTKPKQQARQIYALKKRINYYSKLNKPEIKTHSAKLFNWLINMPLAYNESHGVTAFYERSFIANTHNEDPDNAYVMKGDLIRVQNINIYGQFGFGPNVVPYIEDDEHSLNYSAFNDLTAYVRIIVARLPYGGGRDPIRITQDGPQIGESGAYTDLTPINGPLRSGIGKQMKIIYQRVIKIDVKNKCKMYKISLSNKQIGNYKKLSNWPDSYGMNELLIYYQYVAPSVLQHRYNSGGQVVEDLVSPNVFFTMNYKVAYIDED